MDLIAKMQSHIDYLYWTIDQLKKEIVELKRNNKD